MAPEKIRVKLVSEAAEYVSVSHVVQREFTLRELVEIMLPVVGHDAARMQRMMRIGTISTGDYRYRWQGVEIETDEVATLLSSFPHPEPGRPFRAENCFLVRFRRGQESLDLPRAKAERRPHFAKQSFWDGLLELAGSDPQYADYDHAQQADRYTLELDSGRWERLRALLPLLKPKSAAERLERLHPEAIEWLARR